MALSIGSRTIYMGRSLGRLQGTSLGRRQGTSLGVTYRAIWGRPQDVGQRDVHGTSVGDVPWRYIQDHMGTSLDVTFSRPRDVSKGRPWGVGRGRPQGVRRGRLLALHRGPYGVVHRTSFGDVLRTSSGRNFAEWVREPFTEDVIRANLQQLWQNIVALIPIRSH